jgi:translation initiation factor IF-3
LNRLKSETKKLAVNGDIRARQVRLIDQDGKQLGVVPIEEALKHAETAALDLVEIAPEAEPVVCKIMDFGKYIYEAKKQKAASRKKQKIIQVKEVKFRPGTEEGDYQVKLRNLIRFLESGDKAKVTLRFRGREMAHQEIGFELIKRIEADLEPYAAVEQFAKMEGRQLTMVLGPKKKK